MANLELQDVKKVYGTGSSQYEALTQINFKANQGETILIVGPSGSGKTTFLTIAAGLQTPSAGTVKIDDKVLGTMSVKQQSQLRLYKIGFVLQAYNLVPYLTVQEQFTLVDKVKKANLTASKFNEILAILGLTPLLDKYPNQLSGGQQQRVAIARALYGDPSFILADEPTASLDTERAIAVMQLFSQLAHLAHKAVIVVTHDTRLKDYADHVYELVDGVMHRLK